MNGLDTTSLQVAGQPLCAGKDIVRARRVLTPPVPFREVLSMIPRSARLVAIVLATRDSLPTVGY